MRTPKAAGPAAGPTGGRTPLALPAALVLTGAVSVQAGAGIAARLFDQVPPAGVTEITYSSGNLGLKAWVNQPEADNARRPAVLFLHGGFAFDLEDWEMAQPFRDAGFVVMTPMLRGEN